MIVPSTLKIVLVVIIHRDANIRGMWLELDREGCWGVKRGAKQICTLLHIHVSKLPAYLRRSRKRRSNLKTILIYAIIPPSNWAPTRRRISAASAELTDLTNVYYSAGGATCSDSRRPVSPLSIQLFQAALSLNTVPLVRKSTPLSYCKAKENNSF